METLIQVIEAHAGAIEALFTLVYLFAGFSFVYMGIKANRIGQQALEEMRTTRQEEMRPYVYLTVEIVRGQWINLKLINRGRHVARHLQVSVDQQIKIRRDDKSFQDLALAQPLEFLAPHGEFVEWLDHSHDFFRKNEDVKELTGKVTYQDSEGTAYESPIEIDLAQLSARFILMEKTTDDLVGGLEQLKRTIEQQNRR
jgi:hypothetical protein